MGGDMKEKPDQTKAKKYCLKTTQIAVLPEGEPLFCDQCTLISIMDEGAGEFLEIEQQLDRDAKVQTIRIDPEEWPAIKEAIEVLLHLES
jgi:hypothetical protein